VALFVPAIIVIPITNQFLNVRRSHVLAVVEVALEAIVTYAIVPRAAVWAAATHPIVQVCLAAKPILMIVIVV